MNFNLLCFIAVIAFCNCTSIDTLPVYQEDSLTEQYTFKLWYSYSGLGSDYGSMQPTFRVENTDFIYTLEQNGTFTGKIDKKPEFVCKGKLRSTSIDSIIDLVKDIKDTLIYKTNPNVMSGGVHTIGVENHKVNIIFRLHNVHDSTAQKMVDILNSNIPADKAKLWIFDFP
jgi:hypothetical protein